PGREATHSQVRGAVDEGLGGVRAGESRGEVGDVETCLDEVGQWQGRGGGGGAARPARGEERRGGGQVAQHGGGRGDGGEGGVGRGGAARRGGAGRGRGRGPPARRGRGRAGGAGPAAPEPRLAPVGACGHRRGRPEWRDPYGPSS